MFANIYVSLPMHPEMSLTEGIYVMPIEDRVAALEAAFKALEVQVTTITKGIYAIQEEVASLIAKIGALSMPAGGVDG